MSLISDDPGERLAAMREKVDRLDEAIVALVAGRTALVLGIADAKQQLGLPTMVPNRHGEVVQSYMAAVPEGSSMTPADAVRLSETIQEISREAQDRYRAGEVVAQACQPGGLDELAASAAALLAETVGGAQPAVR